MINALFNWRAEKVQLRGGRFVSENFFWEARGLDKLTRGFETGIERNSCCENNGLVDIKFQL